MANGLVMRSEAFITVRATPADKETTFPGTVEIASSL